MAPTDTLQLSRIRYDHLMPQLTQHLAHPVAVGSRFQCDSGAPDVREFLFQAGLRAAYPPTLYDFSLCIQPTEVTMLIPHIDADGDGWLPFGHLCCARANFLIFFLLFFFTAGFLSAP